MKQWVWIWIIAACVVMASPANFEALAETSCVMTLMDGAVKRDFGAKMLWDDCKCKASEKIFTVSEGQSLPAQVLIPSQLASRGIAGAKSGDKLTITWQERDLWTIEHSPTGKSFRWRWRMPLPPTGQ